MKIGFLVLSLGSPGGIERITTAIANELSARRHQVTIINVCGAGKTYYYLDERIQIVTLCPVYSRMREYFFNKVLGLRRILRRFCFDFLVTVDSYLYILTFLGGLGLGRKNVVWEHFNCMVTWDKPTRTIIRRLCTKTADAVVPLTERDADYYRSLGRYKSFIKSISNPNPYECLSEPHVDKKVKTVLAVGRLSCQKGFDLLLKAWQNTIDRENNWKLQIVGSGEQEGSLKTLSKQLALMDTVEFIPSTQAIERYYQRAAFLVAPSRFEGFPLVLIEAKGFGLPCVSFDCETGPREIIEDGYDGFLIEAGDVSELSKKMRFLIENPEIRKTFSYRALENSRKYEIQNIVKVWEDLFYHLQTKSV